MIAWNDYGPGSYRVTCPACGRSPRDKTAGVTIEHDGRGVLHCFRCSLVETHRPAHGNGGNMPLRKPLLTPKRTALSEWGTELWRSCKPVAGVAADYLRTRRCAIPPENGDLRWHPALKTAKRDRDEAELRRKEYEDRLAQARAEATALVDEGRRDALVTKQRIEEEAQREADKRLERAKREIQIATETATKELYQLSTRLATEMAGKVIGRELTPQDHERLIAESLDGLNPRN